jgi:hypothetical protein
MSERYPGGVITKNPATPTGPYESGAAPGIWTLDQQLQYQQQGIWPTAGLQPNYIEDVFSTYLYTGTGAALTITNNIDLSTKGGLVWTKTRNAPVGHGLVDTVRGGTQLLDSSTTLGNDTYSGYITAFNTTGYSLGASGVLNDTYNMVSWTFRKQPKFFDIVTYTGTGSATTIAHNLGSNPGCMIVKRTDANTEWAVYHRSLGATQGLNLNRTYADFSAPGYWNDASPTSTVINVGNGSPTNASGGTYVAYLFAHNAGGFGLTGTDNVISCGSFTTSTVPDTITLGYEPQWVLIKSANSATNWYIFDNMRGIPTGGLDLGLKPNLSSAESADANFVDLTATGFISNIQAVFGDGINLIYIAIRRGPMKVPTLGTSVFKPAIRTGTGTTATVSGVGFPPDAVLSSSRMYGSYGGYLGQFWDRLRGAGKALRTPTTAAEVTVTNAGVLGQDGYTVSNSSGGQNDINDPFVDYSFLRAPSFFDEVCYTGTGVARTVTHNLAAVPELMIVKCRTPAGNEWIVYASPLGNQAYLQLNRNYAATTSNPIWNNTTPTSSVFSVELAGDVNGSGNTLVAYLFATCAGVSKVGSYTGNGTTQTIDCGFTGGARFVLLKRTDATGGWYVYDTARGMTVLTDPYLLLNTVDDEVATLGSVTTVSTGFALNSSVLAAINVNAGTYVFLAIA